MHFPVCSPRQCLKSAAWLSHVAAAGCLLLSQTVLVLEDLKAFDKPRLVLLNKMDKVTEETQFAINSFCLSGEKCLKVSVTKDESMEQVLNEVDGILKAMV